MRALRFFLQEILLRGVFFAVMGTAVLASLYLLTLGSPMEKYQEAGRSFIQLIFLSQDFSTTHPGFSASDIVGAAAAVTLPLALASLAILVLSALSFTAFSTATGYLEREHGETGATSFLGGVKVFGALLASIPLFAGFWMMGTAFGSQVPMLPIAAVSVAVGGLGWDASRFLLAEMQIQMEATHTAVFSVLPLPLGSVIPLPGTYSGYLLSSSFPRFIPYLAGKVPAIIGGATIAEIIFSFPGLGSTLMEGLLSRNTDLMIASLFFLLCLNALVVCLVKLVLFALYPRLYEKVL